MSWKLPRPSGRSTIALNDKPYFATELLLGLPQVVVDLHAIPELRRRAERLGKAQCHLRADAGSAIQQARERHAADAQALVSRDDQGGKRDNQDGKFFEGTVFEPFGSDLTRLEAI